MSGIKNKSFIPFGSLFLAALLILPLAHLFLPKAEYSVPERRFLAQPPRFSWDSGVFSQAVESYVNDYFPLRPALLRVDAARRQISGQQVQDPIWRLADGSLVEAPVSLRGTRLQANLDRLNAFAAQSHLPTFLMMPPSAGAVSTQATYYGYPDAQVEADLPQLAPNLQLIPLLSAFRAAKPPLFFGTDPHWNAQGAYLAYTQAAPALGFEPLSESAFTKQESKGFYGTAYARSALWETPSDTIELWDAGLPLRLRFAEGEEGQTSLFFTEHLQGADQYPVFLDGNHGLTIIDNLENPQGNKLLVLKDSFANSLIPLLVPHFARITAVDLRAYRAGNILALDDFDAILAVYSLNILANDANFPWLR